jgi:hypothetical protein
MERMAIDIDDYRKALETATDEGYRAHLLNDFVVRGDKVYPKIDIVQSMDRSWNIRSRT